MSGVAGVFHRDGSPVQAELVEGMLKPMSYRGPDGSDVWTGGAVGFACLMLRTTPESSKEQLPKTDADGRFVITADARIDNRDDLIARLGLETSAGRLIDDSDLILKAHERWGEGAPTELDGDFAYCIWDPVKNELFCARDAFGVRPFYYHLTDKIFAFASEIRPLLSFGEIPARLNETMVGDYLVGMQDDQAITFYQGILRLPPGHFMIVSPTGFRIQRYWSLDPNSELVLRSDEEYAETFRELFIRAVKSRLRSAYPVATNLSGGLDSSSVTCVAERVVSQSGAFPLFTLSVIYDHVRECDERKFIDFVVSQRAFKPLYLTADSVTPYPYLNLTELYDHDDPFDAQNSFSQALMTKLADHGIRVALDGFDGDNTVSHGTAYLAELAAQGRLIKLVREVKALSSRLQASFMDLMWRKAIRPLTPAAVRRAWRLGAGYVNRPWPKDALISQEFAEKVRLTERYLEFRGFSLKPMVNAREEHCRSLAWGGLTKHLEAADKLGARYSIEPRHPFFDRKLAEFCVAIPHDQKISNGWTRLVMRRAMSGILPEGIRWRTDKVDFFPSLIHGIVGLERGFLEALFKDCQERVADFVDIRELEARFRQFLAEPMAGDPSALWPVISLGLWLHRSSLSS
jgi:asparagine synthase (glutamine-hydrolysing)